jgi:glycosyltransferase involved in cell wall biosynthesis
MQDLIIISRAGSSQRTYAGGADARAYYILKALSYYNQNVIYLILCTDCDSVNILHQYRIIEVPIKRLSIHSFNFMSIDNAAVLIKTVKALQFLLKRYRDLYVIVVDPISLHYWMYAKKLLMREGYNVKVLWAPGGNELTCPLHTEICPFSNSYTRTYGHCTSPLTFFSRCIPHIVRSRGLSIYHTVVYPMLRREIIKYVDGILASRSVYIEGCKMLGLTNCKFVGFGIDTEIFSPKEKNEAIRKLFYSYEHIKARNIWGDFDSLLSNVRDKRIITLGFIGATKPSWKNSELLIKAFNDISVNYDNIFLLIVAREANYLIPLISRLPERSRKRIVVFDGVSHIYIPAFYNLIDIFVNPSLLDSLEINTLEALVSGNIVLASNRGCINDLKYLGIESYIIFEPNRSSLYTALIKLLENFDLYRAEMLRHLNDTRQKLSLYSFGRRVMKALNEMFAGSCFRWFGSYRT